MLEPAGRTARARLTSADMRTSRRHPWTVVFKPAGRAVSTVLYRERPGHGRGYGQGGAQTPELTHVCSGPGVGVGAWFSVLGSRCLVPRRLGRDHAITRRPR